MKTQSEVKVLYNLIAILAATSLAKEQRVWTKECKRIRQTLRQSVRQSKINWENPKFDVENFSKMFGQPIFQLGRRGDEVMEDLATECYIGQLKQFSEARVEISVDIFDSRRGTKHYSQFKQTIEKHCGRSFSN